VCGSGDSAGNGALQVAIRRNRCTVIKLVYLLRSRDTFVSVKFDKLDT
jgi:hypothetical protein